MIRLSVCILRFMPRIESVCGELLLMARCVSNSFKTHTFEREGIVLPSLVAFVLGVICVFVCTSRFGVGVTPDSATYLSQAESLRTTGRMLDYSQSFTVHYPPCYPALLAVTSAVGRRDIRHGAPRLLSAMVVGGTLFAVHIWFSLLQIRPLARSAGMVALGFHPVLLEYGICALTDCLFVAVIASCLCALELWARQRRSLWFWIAVTCSALGLMTRYAGVVWPMCCATALLLQTGKSWSRAAGEGALFLVASVAPLLIWLVFVRFMMAGSAPRSIAFHPPTAEVLRQGLSVICGSLGLQGYDYSVLVPLMIAAGGCLASGLLQRSNHGNFETACHSSSLSVRVVGLYLIGYPLFLLLSITLLDRATPLDGRILLSSIWALILLFTWLVHIGLRDNRVYEVGCWLLIVWFGTRGLVDTLPRLAEWRENGYGLACAEVLYDRNLKYVREVASAETRVYSNVSWSVWLACRRPVSQLESRFDYTSGGANTMFDQSLQGVIREVQQGKAIVVLDRLFADPLVLTPTVEDLRKAGLQERTEEGQSRFVVFCRAR